MNNLFGSVGIDFLKMFFSHLIMNYFPIFLISRLVLSCTKHRDGFKTKCLLGILLTLFVAFVFSVLEMIARLNLQMYYIFFSLLGFCAMYFVIALALWILFDISFFEASNAAITGYTFQNLVWKTFAFFMHLFNIYDTVVHKSPVLWSGMVALVLVGFIVMQHFHRQDILSTTIAISRYKRDKNTYFVTSATLTGIIILSFLCDVFYRSDKYLYLSSCLLSVLTCVFILMVQFGKIQLWKKEEALNLQRRMLEMEHQQYEQLRNNVEVINIKCHDLKHQLVSLREQKERTLSKGFLNEMEEAIRGFEVNPATGNEIIDIAIADKWFYCNAKGIRFSCMVDGEKLAFMKEDDLFSLFGNALDNAITAASKMPEELRVISVTTSQKANFLLLQFQNYFDGGLKFTDGLPQTTKEDIEYHGFGIKSIRSIVEKYEGSIRINSENQIFKLDILFPLSD